MTGYELIKSYYGEQKAERSQVPLINHIDQGLKVLDFLCVDTYTKEAYCIHPIIQSDINFASNLPLIARLNPTSVALAVEYRHVANAWLSDKVLTGPYFPHWKDEPRKAISSEVNMMLIADKVQNYKDFVTYHKGVHERSAELETYFQRWFNTLGITEERYQVLAMVMNDVPVPVVNILP